MLWFVNGGGRFIMDFFEDCGVVLGSKAHNKQIPSTILQSPKPVMTEFLRGYFECDGFLGTSVGECYTASRALAEELRITLLRYGIVAKGFFMRCKNPFTGKDTSYGCKLQFEGNFADIFYSEIGFVSKRKMKNFKKKNRNTNVDVIPSLKSAIINARNRRSAHAQPGSHFYVIDGQLTNLSIGFNTIAKNVTYSYMQQHPDHVANLHKLDKKLGATVEWLMDNKPFWERVISIEVVGEKEVMDLSVPDGNSYVANGFYTHNSNVADLRVNSMQHETRDVVLVTRDKLTDEKLSKLMSADANARRILLGLTE
jgi:hypothetical protein